MRKTIDAIIATRCIENGFMLLYSDKDCDPFVQHLGLSWSNSCHNSPGCARTVRAAGSTRMPFINDRSIISLPSHTAVPATLWPPPRTDVSTSWVTAKRTASSTSAAPTQRTIKA